MTDASLVDKLTQTVESLLISDSEYRLYCRQSQHNQLTCSQPTDLQDNMAGVSETFGHLVESIEQSKETMVLWEQATRLAQTVAGTLVSGK